MGGGVAMPAVARLLQSLGFSADELLQHNTHETDAQVVHGDHTVMPGATFLVPAPRLNRMALHTAAFFQHGAVTLQPGRHGKAFLTSLSEGQDDGATSSVSSHDTAVAKTEAENAQKHAEVAQELQKEVEALEEELDRATSKIEVQEEVVLFTCALTAASVVGMTIYTHHSYGVWIEHKKVLARSWARAVHQQRRSSRPPRLPSVNVVDGSTAGAAAAAAAGILSPRDR